ncbi:hypothetical protein RRG08_031765 [Elysia crispata]|uniref:Leucine--tRNA ligase n=1 Tax=Elysia crispata TaxID=231223 RepID=A0AAE1E772_9GAST|nr:hypothetical protein RRG08_031765 [Elysia crispata]
MFRAVSGRAVYLMAATETPETLSGQTNCWLRPDMEYVAMETKTGDVYVCTRRAGRNMSYQGITAGHQLVILLELRGRDIIGAALETPLTFFKTIYALPLMTIPDDKGTGILPSVPAENPVDRAALAELKTNRSLRTEYGVAEEMLLNYDGVATLNCVAGQNIVEVRKAFQNQIVSKGEAVIYMEPEKFVMSRSGSECVAALCDQWYLDYGASDWRAKSQRCLAKMNLFFDEVRDSFEKSLNDLGEHACSRTDGLGSRIPWDRRYLIENMSDSNINMAYYTVCPLLQGHAWDGSAPGPANIRPEQLTPEVWDYVLLKDKPYPSGCDIPQSTLDKLKREFEYWYPVDDRMSGKDLISNNLTYYIYGHTAMWPDDQSKWPKAIRANGHLLINSKKMSKSTGNFCTLKEAIDRFSADGMRLTLAGAGDGVEDANFVEEEAEHGLLSLHSFLEWVREMLRARSCLRKGNYSFHDKVFASEINNTNRETRRHYQKYLYKAAVRTGFFDFQSKLSQYREAEPRGMHHDLVFRFIEIQVLLISPICPHMAEYIWGLLGKPTSVMWAAWPEAGEVDHILLQSSRHLHNCVREFKLKRETFSTAGDRHQVKPESPTHATVWVASPSLSIELTTGQGQLELQKGFHHEETLAREMFKQAALHRVIPDLAVSAQTSKDNGKAVTVQDVEAASQLDEMRLFRNSSEFIINTLGLTGLEVRRADNTEPVLTSDLLAAQASPSSRFAQSITLKQQVSRFEQLEISLDSEKIVMYINIVDTTRVSDGKCIMLR